MYVTFVRYPGRAGHTIDGTNLARHDALARLSVFSRLFGEYPSASGYIFDVASRTVVANYSASSGSHVFCPLCEQTVVAFKPGSPYCRDCADKVG